MTNEHYLEVAKECGFDMMTIAPSIVIDAEQLDAYTSRICAEKDAAIAMKDEALKRMEEKLITYGHERDGSGTIRDILHSALSTTPESIAAWEAEKLSDGKLYSAMSSVAVLKQNTDLQRQVAMQADKLNKIKFLDGYDGCRLHHSAAKLLNEAIEASSSTVAKWEAEKQAKWNEESNSLIGQLEIEVLSLKRQVAMLHNVTRQLNDCTCVICSDCARALKSVITDAKIQATTEAFMDEHDAKVLEEAKSTLETMNAIMKVSVPDVIDALQQMADELQNKQE